jgi:RimJ/RimL family protein N-acetyltransferase
MFPLAPVVLAGRHVRLEPLGVGHVAGLVAAAANAGSRDSFLWTYVPGDEAEMRAYVDAALADQAGGRAIPFATVRDGEVVGSTRFFNVERWIWPPGSRLQRPPGCADGLEIGWTWLAASAQRTVVNTEAKRLMLSHAFEAWGVWRVTLKTDARNARSRAAIERLGARLDGLLRANQPAVDDTPRNSAVYSILAEEWPEIRAKLDARLDGS